MTYETYRMIFVAAAVLAGIFLAVSMILFVVLKIPGVVGDLSGMTAKKAIQSIREQNEQSGEKVYKSSRVNMERGKLTEKITPSGRLLQRHTGGFGAGGNETTILTQNMTVQSFFEIEQDITLLHTDEVIMW